MKIKKDTKKAKKKITLAIIVLVALLAFLTYIFVFRQHTSDIPADNTQTEEAKKASSEKQRSKDQQQAKPNPTDKTTNPTDKTTSTNSDTPPAPETNSEHGKTRADMVSSVNMSGDMVFIRGGINYPVAGGTCYAKLSGPSGQSIKKDSTILQNPASTDCKTISIPTSELAPGTWTFTLHYTSDEYEGSTSEVSFTL